MMKSDPEYLLLQVNDQKRVVRIHEMIQTQVKNEFDDSKEKLRTRIQKKLERYQKYICEGSKGEQSLMDFLLAPSSSDIDRQRISSAKTEAFLHT